MKKLFFFLFLIQTALFAEPEIKTLTVMGKGEVQILATVAEISLGVEIKGKEAENVRKNLKEVATRVISYLQEQDIEELKVDNLMIYPEYDKENPMKTLGYKGVERVKFKTSVEKANAFIEKAFEKGVNRVYSVSIKPKKTKLSEARKEALRKAISHALETAKVALETLHLEIKEVVKITISPSHHGPIYYTMKSSNQRESFTSDQLVAQKHSITASVTLEVSY